jgi:hypothetical protein
VTFAGDGNAALRYRVTIDGCPASAVSSMAMVAVASAGVPSRLIGLNIQDEKFEASADVLACKLTVGSISLKVADIDAAWSAVFDKAPENTTWLTADVDDADTTIPVSSTAGFASAGYIWIDSECIAYTSKDATNFLGCTRGSLSDDADAATYHYTENGSRLRSPEVTDWPVLWENRRVRVYRYQETDVATGNGTQVYLGAIASSPRFDGKMWTVGVDSIVSVFEQTLGADLDEPAYPRGITYSEDYPLEFYIWESTNTVPSGDGTSAGQRVAMAGFWETNETFCADLTTAIATAMAAGSYTQNLVARSDGPTRWHLELNTNGSPKAVSLSTTAFSPVDHSFGTRAGGPQNEDGTTVTAVGASATYYYYPAGAAPVAAGEPPGLSSGRAGREGAGGVPRGVFNVTSGYARSRTIYLGGSAPISSLVSAVMIEWQDDSDETSLLEISNFSAADRRVTFPQGVAVAEAGGPRPGFHAWTPASLPTIRFGLLLCSTREGVASDDFLATIVARQQEYSTLGVVPMIRAEDYDAAGWTAAAATGQPSLVTRRVFTTFSPVSVMDIISEELKLAGCFLAVNSAGQLVPKRLRIPAQSELGDTDTIDASTLLTDEVLLNHEVGGLGQVNQVLLRTGYDPQEDEYLGRTWITRDVAAFGQSPSVRQVAIEPKSEYVGPEITEDDVVQCASGYFGSFAGSYAIDTLDAAMHDSVELGDAIVFDNPHLPDETGLIGVTGRVGLVLARVTEPYSPRVRLTVLTTKQRLGGYAPSGEVADSLDEGGNTWVVEIDDSYFPTGSVQTDWWSNGDRVRVVELNTATATVVVGTVLDSAFSSNSMEIQFDGVWGGHSSGTALWYLTMADSDDAALVETQKRFCSIAESDGSIDYDTDDKPAFRFGA